MADDAQLARIEEVIQPVLRDRGLELVDVDWRASRPRGILKVAVDKPGGVRVEDCERAKPGAGRCPRRGRDSSREATNLEVSSPGLDRQLRKERELRWAVGKPVRCWTAGGHEFAGRLAEVRADRLVLEGPASPSKSRARS